VLIDGAVVNSCLVAAGQVEGCDVVHVEGLANGGELSALQQAFIERGAAQCGICTPGMLLAAHALLRDNPRPPPTRCGSGWPATCVAAPATPRSSTPCSHAGR